MLRRFVLVVTVLGLLLAVAPSVLASFPMANLDQVEVENTVEREVSIRQIQARRPAVRMVLRFDPSARVWIVTLRERSASVDLARYKIDDKTGEIISRFILPLGKYPNRLTPSAATDIARKNADLQRLAYRWGGVDRLGSVARLEGCCWEVDFTDPANEKGEGSGPVIRVDIRDSSSTVLGVWTGIQIPWKMARGDRYAFGGGINKPVVWFSFFVLFALLAIDWRNLFSLLNADVLALLSFGVSYEFFQRGMINWSVPLSAISLTWLCVRGWWVFTKGLPATKKKSSDESKVKRLVLRRVPTVLLVLLVVMLAGARIGVTVWSGNVIDVGAAGVIGARDELKGKAVWGNMPSVNPHGDTYGPLNYLAYVPAELAFHKKQNQWWEDTIDAGKATAISADILCTLLLMLIGWRWISKRAALLLAAMWLACPWTSMAMASGVNDALVAVFLLAAFALLKKPTLRGMMVGAAAMVKFAPLAAMMPLLHSGTSARKRQAVLTSTGVFVAVLVGLLWVAMRIHTESVWSDLHLFWQRTVGFQGERGSPFSVWGLYGWKKAQHLVQAVVVLTILAAAFFPRKRDAWQVAAGVSAAMLSIQLTVTHWFYPYLVWSIGFILLVIVSARERNV